MGGYRKIPAFFKQKRLRKGRAGAELGLAELEAQAQDEVGSLWRVSQDTRPFLNRKGCERAGQVLSPAWPSLRRGGKAAAFLRAASPKPLALSVTLAVRFFNAQSLA
jgi:hypothetical protein